ncbi:glycosyl transferase [Clostridia bacterium]|nr:glycosyl transferase [Clostridia bacterium]
MDKVIHYCWFGGNPLPDSAKKCIASWGKYFPDYEIKEWNESNFDINANEYTKQAHEAKKYAFVSDYARMWILYTYGGLYFDTDVEVIKPFDDILEKGSFMGFEIDGGTQDKMYVAPGLGLAATKGLKIYKEVLDVYDKLNFYKEDGTRNNYAIVSITTDVLLANGLKNQSGIQTVGGINLYPAEYFNPFNDATGKLNKTENTHSIHWFSKTWMSPKNIIQNKITRVFHRVFGINCFAWLNKLLKRK